MKASGCWMIGVFDSGKSNSAIEKGVEMEEDSTATGKSELVVGFSDSMKPGCDTSSTQSLDCKGDVVGLDNPLKEPFRSMDCLTITPKAVISS